MVSFLDPVTPFRLFGMGEKSQLKKNPRPTLRHDPGCQEFCHRARCTKPAKCVRCSGLLSDHSNEACTKPEKCVNCRGPFPASHESCAFIPKVINKQVVYLTGENATAARRIGATAYLAEARVRNPLGKDVPQPAQDGDSAARAAVTPATVIQTGTDPTWDEVINDPASPEADVRSRLPPSGASVVPESVPGAFRGTSDTLRAVVTPPEATATNPLDVDVIYAVRENIETNSENSEKEDEHAGPSPALRRRHSSRSTTPLLLGNTQKTLASRTTRGASTGFLAVRTLRGNSLKNYNIRDYVRKTQGRI